MNKILSDAAIYLGFGGFGLCVIATYIWAENQLPASQQTITRQTSDDSADVPKAPDNFLADQFIVLNPSISSAQTVSATLGVHVRHADVTLRHHLGLAEGVGLVVEHVTAKSAAEESGVQKHDVLHKLNDQILINDQQLHTLIKMHKPGDQIRLTLVRAGKTENLNATLKQGSGPSSVELFHDYHVQGKGNAIASLAKFHDLSDPSTMNCSNCHTTHGKYTPN